MDDLISREALLDYLRNDFGYHFPLYDGTRLGTTQRLVTMNDVIAAIQHNVPAVEAEPVPCSLHRPEDCRFYTNNFYLHGGGCLGTKEIDPCAGAACERWKPKEDA